MSNLAKNSLQGHQILDNGGNVARFVQVRSNKQLRLWHTYSPVKHSRYTHPVDVQRKHIEENILAWTHHPETLFWQCRLLQNLFL